MLSWPPARTATVPVATLARCAAGFERPDSGEIVRHCDPCQIQLIFQQPAASLNPRFTAREILEEEGLAALSLRSVARRAGVSHAAPYRHFSSREALLADVAIQGLKELQAEIAAAGAMPGDRGERIVHIGGAYLRFGVRHSGLLRLMA